MFYNKAFVLNASKSTSMHAYINSGLSILYTHLQDSLASNSHTVSSSIYYLGLLDIGQ